MSVHRKVEKNTTYQLNIIILIDEVNTEKMVLKTKFTLFILFFTFMYHCYNKSMLKFLFLV